MTASLTASLTANVTATAIPMLTDNYAWGLREAASGKTAIVDPAEPGPAIAWIEAAGGRLDAIFLTHHHDDHIGGVPALLARYGARDATRVIGNACDAHRLPKLDIAVHEGDLVEFGAATARVIDTPGHTVGHIAYYFADGELLFPGDTLFSLGCGRLFEGSAADMYRSLQKFGDLPDHVLVCAGHEYTESNAKFALSVDPDNETLRGRAAEVAKLRREGARTLPVSLQSERACNPFLRAPDAEALGRLRSAKDHFA